MQVGMAIGVELDNKEKGSLCFLSSTGIEIQDPCSHGYRLRTAVMMDGF
jgi:hypothetical protein